MTGLVQQVRSQLKSPVVVGMIMFLAVSGVVGYLSHTTLTVPPLSKLRSSQPPTPTIFSRTETQQFLSSDGTKKLTLKVDYTSDLDTYFVYVSDRANRHLVYAKQWGKGEALLTPSKDNWSLNSAYVFVILSAPDEVDPLIFKTDGSIFPNGNTYLDIDELLYKQTDYYVNSPIRWVSNTKLEFSVVKDLSIQPFHYIFNVVTHTFTKVVI